MPLNSLDRLLFIRQVPIFKELRDDFLMRLAPVMDEVYFEAGYTIITEGQEGRSMYIVVSGQVAVHLGGQQVAQFNAGDCFGEMSVFDAEPRSASVTTLEPCKCLVLTQQQLYDAIEETPGIAVNIIRLLSRRIRELNQELNIYKGRPGAKRRLPPLASAANLFQTPSTALESAQREKAKKSPDVWEEQFPYGNVTF
ncbi:MAG TPA: cyclic nucleotide-binding domain-containing protein [Leptolyngbyaceae cyanobacterium M65_K2018_010]|nr:cyclic nucleotide-binding domain-containing protein [Leptolyngbyaceae cyanobacterium M65_K2018_010]